MRTIHDFKYSFDQVHSSLCLYEELLRRRNASGSETKLPPDIESFWDGNGINAIREACIEAAEVVDILWADMSDDYRDVNCFDWEFIPTLVDSMTIVNNSFVFKRFEA